MNKMQSEFDQIVSARLEIDFQTVATWRIDIKRFFFYAISFNYMYETHSSLIS